MEVKAGEAALFCSRNKTEVKILREGGSLRPPVMEQGRVLVKRRTLVRRDTIFCREETFVVTKGMESEHG